MAVQPNASSTLIKKVLTPQDTRRLMPEAELDLWLYQYIDSVRGWSLSIGTHGEPGSGKLSLGGFRIVPADRAALPGFDPGKEALGLATGMEEKVYWSRLIRVGGPLALQNLNRIVGGKCVLLPTADARVGQPRDRELLDFAISCCKDFEETSGVFLTTGQDLGHGMLSDGATSSLTYLNKNFRGSVLADTSKPTAEGNYHCLRGGLAGLKIAVAGATIGILGCGNIGEHLLRRLLADGAKIVALESQPAKREKLEALGIQVYPAEEKARFLELPFVALACNANGGTLDAKSIDQLCQNKAVQFICGCENLIMPDPQGVERFRAAKKLYTPTEYCGMMGYLTAVEEYLSRQANQPFTPESLYGPAEKLHGATERAVRRVLERNYGLSFESALREVHTA